jgi:hypothetical protein
VRATAAAHRRYGHPSFHVRQKARLGCPPSLGHRLPPVARQSRILAQRRHFFPRPQDHSPLNIIDLLTSELVSVQPDRFQTPFAFIFLYDRQSFLAFRQKEVLLWNLNGEKISHFQDHSLWFPAAAQDHTSVIFITENQDVVSPQWGWRGGGDSRSTMCCQLG